MKQWPAVKPFLSRKIGIQPAYLLGLLLFFLTGFARADVWAYIDDKGLAHFAPEQLDARYEVYFRGEGLLGQTDSPSAVNLLDPDTRQPVLAAGTSRVATYFEISPGVKAVRHHVRDAARSLQIDDALLQAIIATESGFDTLAVSPKGAIGLMQLMPTTAERFGVVADKKATVEKKLTDPHTNIWAGSRYLRYLLGLFPGQMELAVAAYNAGEGAVQRAGNQIPNFQETRNYVKTVMQLYDLLKLPTQLLDRQSAPKPASGRARMTVGGAVGRSNMLPAQAPVPRVSVDIYHF